MNRQVSKGIQVYGNYVWSKTMSNMNGPLDTNNRKIEKAVESYDIPHMAKAYVTYELPVGKGRALFGGAPRAVAAVVKGWSFSLIVNYFSGTPLGFGGSSPISGAWNGGGNRANVAAGPLMLDSFDKGKFELSTVNSPNNTILVKSAITDPAPLTLGTSAVRYSQARGFATRNEDIGIQKVQAFGENGKYRFRLRAEFLNLLNRHTLGGITTSPTSTTFGQVTSVSGNRTGQVTLRLDF